MRRTTFESLASGFDSRFHVIGDFDLTIRIAENWKIDCVQETLASYRIHGKNESTKHKERHVKELETWLGEMKKRFSRLNQEVFNNIMDSCSYLKALYWLDQHKIWEAVIIFLKLPLGKEKLKLLATLILPKIALEMLK